MQVFAPVTSPAASITFNDLPATYGDAPFSLNATSNSTGTISYSIVADPSNTGEVTLSGDGNKIVTIVKAGKVKLKASVAEDENYLAASKEVTLTINKANQIISFNALNDVSITSTSFTLIASATSTLPVTFSITEGTSLVSISGSTVILLSGTGKVTIQASQIGNENFLPAVPVSSSFQITDSKPLPSITFSDLQVNYGDDPLLMNASSNSTGEISYSVISDLTNTGEVMLSGTHKEIVTIKKAGKVKVKVSVAEDLAHSATSKDIILTIKKALLTATANNATKAYGESNPPLSISFSGFKYGDNANNLTSTPTLSTSATSASSWGSYAIDVAGGIDESYDFKYISGTLFVTKALQTISFTEIPDQLTTSPSFSLIATSSVNLPVTFKIIKGDDLVSLNESAITLKGLPGKVTLEASQSGNESYHSASTTQSFQIAGNVVSGLVESVIEEIYVGPNPASDFIVIRVLPEFQVDKITLTDLQGRLVINKSVTTPGDLSLPVSGLSKGMHIVGIFANDKCVFRKLVID